MQGARILLTVQLPLRVPATSQLPPRAAAPPCLPCSACSLDLPSMLPLLAHRRCSLPARQPDDARESRSLA